MGSGISNDKRYYRLELTDYSAVSFCSFGKYYFGTLEEIRTFIDRLEKERGDSQRELVSAFRAYEAGQTDASHHTAFQKVPLLTPAVLVHQERLVLEDYAWNHLNIWQSIYKMRCKKVESEHLWFECEGRFFRSVKAAFKELQLESALGGWKAVTEKMLWGFPCMIRGDALQLQSMLAESERGLGSMEELEGDWKSFKKSPDPQFTGFCDDIFGDG